MYKEKSLFFTKPVVFNDRRTLNSSDLAALITSMKNEETWVEGELKSVVLLRSPAKKIILTILHKGTEISSFQSDDSLAFQMIEGSVKLKYGKNSFTLNREEILMMKEKIKYKILSIEDSAFLMILTKGKDN